MSSARPLSESLSGSAKADYESGKVLYTDGDFNGALIKFRGAYDTSKDARLLWNVAVCEKSLRHYGNATRVLRYYITSGRDVLTDSDRKEANELLEAIRPYATTIKINASEPGAVIYVDDQHVGTTPLVEPLLVDIGVRKIRVSKQGFRDYANTLTLGGTGEVMLDVRMDRDVHEGRLIVNAEPNDSISIDGKALAMGHLDQSLASGVHKLQVTAQGMRAYETEIVVADNATRTSDVKLEAEGSFKMPTWAWIAGGAVVAAGAVVGGIFIFKPKDAEPTPGTLGIVGYAYRMPL